MKQKQRKGSLRRALPALLMCLLGLAGFALCVYINVTTPRLDAARLSQMDHFPENGPVILTGGERTEQDGNTLWRFALHWEKTARLHTTSNTHLTINGVPAEKEGDSNYTLTPTEENGGQFLIEAGFSRRIGPKMEPALYFGSVEQIGGINDTVLAGRSFILGSSLSILLACLVLYFFRRGERYLLWLAVLCAFTANYYLVQSLLNPVLTLLGLSDWMNNGVYLVVNQLILIVLQGKVMRYLMPVRLGGRNFLVYALPAALPAILLSSSPFYSAALAAFFLTVYLCYGLCISQIPAERRTDRMILSTALLLTVTLRFFEIATTAGLIPAGNVNLRFRLRGMMAMFFAVGFFLVVLRRYAQKFNEAERLSIHLEEESRRKAREQTLFVRSMLHNLKTPVFSLSGYSDMALQCLDSSPAQARRYIKKTGENALFVGRMMDHIFLVTQIQSDMLRLQRMPVNLTGLLQAVLGTVTEAARGKHLQETLDAPETLSMEGDPLYLRQTFQNIVDNARIHTPDGGSLRVEAAAAGKWAVIRFRDTGCGIPPEEQGKVFEAYYSHRHDGKQSSGLGLYISAEIVRLHGGAIAVESKPGEGTCFTVQLPLTFSDGSEKI